MIAKDVLEPNPFAKAPLAEGGNATAQEIYTGVGLALDRWEHCNISFATVYSALVKPEGSNHALMRAFGTISSPNAKREMTWEACDAFFASYPNDDLKKTTRHLLNLYRSAASRRNDIAHAMVMGEVRYKMVDNKAVPLPTIWFLVRRCLRLGKTRYSRAARSTGTQRERLAISLRASRSLALVLRSWRRASAAITKHCPKSMDSGILSFVGTRIVPVLKDPCARPVILGDTSLAMSDYDLRRARASDWPKVEPRVRVLAAK